MTREKQMWDLYVTFLESGLSWHIFCESHRINIHTFKYWQRKFVPNSNQSFVRISTSSNKSFEVSCSDIVLEYPNGVKLKITAGMDVIQQLICLV